jgi:NADPH:quinone reductase-like Zn-dependent oxidoreductase
VKAIVFERYGSPDVLKIAEVQKPVPKEHQVLIKVHAGAVNPADYVAMDGSTRLMTGLFKPKLNRLGIDVAGVVEAIGPKVSRFKPGDEIYGACIRNPSAWGQAAWFSDFGSFAEYTISHEAALDLKPRHLSFEEAASVASVAWTALQGLRTYATILPGDKVLINSATGGVGTMAVQIAKALGAEVTGVCSTKNLDLVKSLGADHVIDYIHDDYIKQGKQYNLIFDSVGTDSLRSLRKMLNPGGRVVVVGIRTGKLYGSLLPRMLSATFMSWITRGDIAVDFSRPHQGDLKFITQLLSTEKIRPVVAKQYSSLAAVPEAERYVREGHAWGKAVVTI